jgi:hypothetical protein
MHLDRSIVAAAGLAGLLIASAAAQTPPTGQGDGTPGSSVTVPTGSLQRAQNAWRGRTLIGTPVFNDNGQRVATINDLLITDAGMVDRVVLSVTQPRRLVAIPFGQLRFVPSQSIGTPVGRRGRHLAQITTDSIRPFGVLLPGASRESLAAMETFRFVPSP